MGAVAKRVQSRFVNTDTKRTEPFLMSDVQIYRSGVLLPAVPAIEKVRIRRISTVHGILNGSL